VAFGLSCGCLATTRPRRVGTGSGINGSMDSWELLEDVAPNKI
jgi:hypothetical protein